jgi:hypothetical protein
MIASIIQTSNDLQENIFWCSGRRKWEIHKAVRRRSQKELPLG